MGTKIQQLSELESILCDAEKTDKGVLDFFNQFKIARLLQPFKNAKTKGYEISLLLQVMCIYRLRGLSIWAMQKKGIPGIFSGDENGFYRLMNNSKMNWRKLLLSFAKQFVAITKAKGDENNSPTFFIIDDSDLEKTGKTIEGIGKIFNHVTRKSILGFKLLFLSFWDGKSSIAIDFSLHREVAKGNYGMTPKELKAQFNKKRDKDTPGYKRAKELDQKKPEVAISMIKRAVKNGVMASYVLMDSWFVGEHMIKSIRSIKSGAMHVLGMCKIDMRKFTIYGKEMNSKQIITKYSRKNCKYSRIYKSQYLTIVGDYKGVKVKLFYIKYRNAQRWTLLLTTDLSLSFVKAMEFYQIRWTIEVLFKECKQYLRLGTCQNTDFDGQIADATIVFITHTILSMQRRFVAYETMGALFRETQQHLIELNLWERILKIFLKMLRQLLTIFSIDVEETIEKIMHDENASKQLFAMLNALKDDEDNCQNITKNAA